MVPAEPPFLRAVPLCCLLNPEWKCYKCGGAICEPCNQDDCDRQSRGEGDIGYMGHIGESCLEIVNSEEANLLWNKVK